MIKKDQLKLSLKRIIAKWNLALISKTRVLASNPMWEIRFNPSYVLARLLVENPEINIVQIGAYDGVSHDFVSSCVMAHGKRGKILLVEPQPEPFAKLKAAYAGFSNVLLENCAISSECQASIDFFCVRQEYRHLDPNSEQYSGLTPLTIIKYMSSLVDDVSKIIEKSCVPCSTFQELLQKHHFDSVDFLAIDTEGHDADIIRSISWEKTRPRAICFEILHLKPEVINDIYTLLNSKGYKMHECFPDCVALDSGSADEWSIEY